ncbi:alpha/beta fold hydrolase [Micromonospora tulbaghiae]|uniref:alpha/beta fold hydrolase n=1 Tax=Micromonospora tulbaghiae TaxID=479978 RepID=UPI003433C91D
MAGAPRTIACMTAHDVEHLHGMPDGPREAPPLLLIHGSGAAGASWEPMIPALAGHHHVIRVDLPGCGRSSPAPSYDVAAQADRAVEGRHEAVRAVLSGAGSSAATVPSSASACAERLPASAW